MTASFDDPDEHPGRTRTNDHATSRAGAKAVAFRAGSQKALLLRVYANLDHTLGHWRDPAIGYTDEQAAEQAHLTRSCYWKRCGELREDGLIEETGAERPGSAGVPRIICRITPEGRLRDAAVNPSVNQS